MCQLEKYESYYSKLEKKKIWSFKYTKIRKKMN